MDTGHVVDQPVNGKQFYTEEHTQLHVKVEETEEDVQLQGGREIRNRDGALTNSAGEKNTDSSRCVNVSVAFQPYRVWDTASSEELTRVCQILDSLCRESERHRGNMYSVMDPGKSADAMQSSEWEGEECRDRAIRQKSGVKKSSFPPVWTSVLW